MHLKIENASYAYTKQGKKALSDASLEIMPKEFVGVIGPNGSGKTTLLKAVYRAISLDKGTIYLDDMPIHKLTHRETALKLGVVSQYNDIPFGFSVKDIVAMGRFPHKTWLQPDTLEDEKIILKALHQVDMQGKEQEAFENLSGGERQRVLIARVLAQQPQFLILDEPTNYLDIKNQIELFDFLTQLKSTVFAAIHDLNMAALYCHKIYVMAQGKIVQSGTPEQVFTKKMLKEVFGVYADVSIHPVTKKPTIVYLPNT